MVEVEVEGPGWCELVRVVGTWCFEGNGWPLALADAKCGVCVKGVSAGFPFSHDLGLSHCNQEAMVEEELFKILYAQLYNKQ